MIEDQFGIIFPWITAKPSPSDAKYLREVRTDLGYILEARAGQALAAAVRDLLDKRGPGKNKLSMIPYEGDDCQAEATQASVISDDPVVMFTPNNPACACIAGTAGKLPQETLFHELVHIVRRLSGHHKKFALKAPMGVYTDNEEFLAVLTTNIFISDTTNRRKSKLRADHQGYRPLGAQLADSFRFFSLGTKAYNLIAGFCDDNPVFTSLLAKVPASFNPVGAFYRNPQKAFNIAANGDADYYFETSWVPTDYAQTPAGTWKREFRWPEPQQVTP